MDALQLLTTDHRKVDRLFEMREGTTDASAKKRLYDQIRSELLLHAQIEESLFYPACAAFPELKEQIDDSYLEHAEVKDLLIEMESKSGTEEAESILDELIESVQDHVQEEEKNLFPKVRQLLGQDKLDALGQKIAEMRGPKTQAA